MKKNKNGFTLVEVVVSMSLLVLVFGGLIGVLILGQEAKINLKNNLIAGNLAQEGVDLVRFIRDQNYDNDGDNLHEDSEVFATIYDDSGTAYSFTIMSNSTGEITVTPYSGGSVKNSEPLMISSHRYMYTTVDPLAIATPFRRVITTKYYSEAIPPYLAVKSEVYWQSDNKQNTVTMYDELTNWRP